MVYITMGKVLCFSWLSIVAMKLPVLICMCFSLTLVTALSGRCYQIAAYGECKGYHPMWAYSQFERKCILFDYSGCGGNKNRFYSLMECQRTCKQTQVHRPKSTTPYTPLRDLSDALF